MRRGQSLQLKELIDSCLPGDIELWLEGLNDRTRFVVERRVGLNGHPFESYDAIAPKLEGVGYYSTVSRGFAKPGTLVVPGRGGYQGASKADGG